jgi:VWFA-related protein
MRCTGLITLALLVSTRTSAGQASATQAPTPPVFKADVEAVYVDAFVTQHGQPLSGLTVSDFDLTDNGVLQRLELLGNDAPPLQAVLAFDTSGSVAGEKLVALRSAGAAFLDSLRPQDPVGLLAFAANIEWLAPLTSDRDAVRTALGRLKAGGATSALDALYAAIVLPGARSLVVLFSDGQDNLSWLDEAQVRDVAERSNALVHIVAIRPSKRQARGMLDRAPGDATVTITVLTDATDREPEYLRSLRQIAEVTGGRLWWADSVERLTRAFESIAAAMKEHYVLRYEPQAVKPGWN